MTIYLDIETRDFFSDEHIKALPRAEQLKAMRLGCAVTYHAEADTWRDWTADQTIDLYNYLVWCAVPVIGWNIIEFDWPVIIHNARAAGWNVLEVETETVRFSDLFALIKQTTGRWYKLEDVCQATLGRGKLADGQKAAEWLRSGDKELIAKAFTYCRHDVELVVSLYSRLLSGEPLRLLPRSSRDELNVLLWKLDGHERIPDESGAISTR